MDAFRDTVTLQLGLFLSCGIGIASLLPDYLFLAVIALLVCLLYTFICLIYLYKNRKLRLGLRSTLLFGTFLVGYVLYLLHLPKNIPSHIENLYNKDKKEFVHIEILDNRRSTTYYNQHIAKVKQLNQKQAIGKILVRIRVNDSLERLVPGQEKIIYTKIQPIAQPVNPFDIDMRGYYKSLGIFHNVTLTEESIIKSIPSSSKLSWRLREKALQDLDKTKLTDNSRQLIQAMVLGYRDEWSADRRAQYSNAGAAHILAISGLHIGLLYLVLFWLALPLQRIFYSRTPVYLICLVGLWMYAWFTGMSPSATRSVSMLSFFIVAKLWQRPAPTLHMLGSSFVVLLLVKPEWLFHIGFQMSYSAVFFILWLYPKAISYGEPKNILVKRIWQIILISCIAQLGVLPWTLHYFGKIPGLFLLSNLIIFSVLSILLVGGMLIILLSMFKVHNGWHIDLYNFLIKQIDAYVFWISKQEGWILSVNKPSMGISIGIFAILLLIFPIFWHRIYNNFRNLSVVGMLFLSVTILSKLRHSKEEIWLVQAFGESLILQIRQNEVTVYTNHTHVDSTYLWARLLDTYRHRKIQKQELPKLFRLGQQTYLHIDSTGIYPDNISDSMVVILQHSTRVNLDKLIHDLSPKQLIADGSNYPSSVLQWKETCIERKTPFLSTSEEGAILLHSKAWSFKTYPEKISDSLAKLSR